MEKDGSDNDFIAWKKRCLEVLSSFTPEKNAGSVMRELAERRPWRFRVNIIGYGLQGEKVHEYLVREDNLMSELLHSVRAFKRSSRPLGDDEKGKGSLPDRATEMGRVQKEAIRGPVGSSLDEYYFLNELYSDHGLTDYLTQAGSPNAMSDILVVAPRYAFPEMDISERSLKKARGTSREKEIHRARANLAATFPHLDSHRGDISALIREMGKTLEDIAAKKAAIEDVMDRGRYKGAISKRGTSLVPDHIIGGIALGEYLKEIDYQGFILSIPNPVDIFTYALMVHSGLPPSRIFGIESHDEARFTAKFIQELSARITFKDETGKDASRYHFTDASIPMFGQHNPKQRPDLSQARFSGIDVLSGERFHDRGIAYFGSSFEAEAEETLAFTSGEYIREYKLLQQGTAPETADAVMRAIEAIILSSDGGRSRLRGCGYCLHYETGRPIVDGLQARLTYRGAYPVMRWGGMDGEASIREGQDSLLSLIEGLTGQGILKDFTREEADKREQQYTLRHQNRGYSPEEMAEKRDMDRGGRTSGQEKVSVIFNIGKVGAVVKEAGSTVYVNMDHGKD